jgi:hypothetical protein
MAEKTRKLPTCYSCGYVVSKGQKEPAACPGCGNAGTFGDEVVDSPGLGQGSKPGTFSEAVEAAEKAGSTKAT